MIWLLASVLFIALWQGIGSLWRIENNLEKMQQLLEMLLEKPNK